MPESPAPPAADEPGVANASPGAEARYRDLVQQVTEYAIFLLDPTGHLVSWNKGAERIKGYRAEEIIGQHFSKFYRPEDVWKCDVELATASREGRVEDEGYRVRKDGSLFWANVVITCLRDPDGQIVGFAKVTRDMSERRKALESLRQSEERFRLLVESVKDYAMFMLDVSGLVASWNSGAERITGYRTDEVLSRHFSCFFVDDDARAGVPQHELQIALRQGRFEEEGFRIRKDGGRFWANVVLTALRDSSGAHIGFAVVTHDLTERRAAERERARLSQLARDRLHALATLAEALASALTLEQVGQTAVEQGTSFIRADTCTIHLLDDRTKDLVLLAEAGCNPAILESVRRLGPDYPLYPIGRVGAPGAWVEGPAQYAALLPRLAQTEVQGPRVQAFVCVPLLAEGRSIGMLGLGFREPRTFSEGDREFIQTFARQCAQATARARSLQAERTIAATVEQLRGSLSTTLRSIGDAVVATDAQGAVTLMNEAAETITGWREVEAQGRPLPDVLPLVSETTRETVPNPVEQVLATGKIVTLAAQSLLVARDGREVPIEDSGAPIRDEGGAIAGVVMVFRDVSERKREESRQQLLAEATNTLSQSLDYEDTVAQVAKLVVPSLADFCAVDLVVAGENALRRLALCHVDPEKEAIAKLLALKHPPLVDAPLGVGPVLRTGRPQLFAEVGEAFLTQVCQSEEHLRLVRQLQLRSAMIVPLNVHGRPFGTMSFVTAESRRKYGPTDLPFAEELARRCANAIENARLYRSERAAREAADVASRAKDEFLAVVSHELRTPLNAILGWSQMLAEAELDENRRKKALETIGRNAAAMTKLIEDLLDTSRAISGKLSLNLQPVDLGSVVAAAIDAVRPSALQRRITLITELESGARPVQGDPTRLQQIVWNLLSNAIKFSAEGGRVEVSMKTMGTAIHVTVADHGRGISPAFLPYVFDPFRQQDGSSSRLHGGLGLGLAISRQLVQLQGGQITARSEGEGRGASFTVSFPLSDPSRLPRTGSSGSERTSANTTSVDGLNVLVVDDDDDARELMASILEENGCEVAMARSAKEALENLSHHPPDVLLSDIGMPGEDGYDLIRRVRALPKERGGEIPAAAISAYTRPDDRRRMFSAGYTTHLPKPIEPAELLEVVATLGQLAARAAR